MFNVINLDVRLSRLATHNAGIVKCPKERFRNSEMLEKALQEAK